MSKLRIIVELYCNILQYITTCTQEACEKNISRLIIKILVIYENKYWIYKIRLSECRIISIV
jgi:hypothetical protein